MIDHDSTPKGVIAAWTRPSEPHDYITIAEAKHVLINQTNEPVNSHRAAWIVRQHYNLTTPQNQNDTKKSTPQIGQTQPGKALSQVIYGVGWRPEIEQTVAEIMSDGWVSSIVSTPRMRALGTVAGRRDPANATKPYNDIRAEIPGDCRQLWQQMRDEADPETMLWRGNPAAAYAGLSPNLSTKGRIDYRLKKMEAAHMVIPMYRGVYLVLPPEKWLTYHPNPTPQETL